MDSQMTTQSAPVLRLSSDIWSTVSDSLDYGDALRLIATGNSLLADRLRHGIRTLKLSWVSSRYIDFNSVLEVVCSFNELYSFTFAEHRHQLRSWMPVSWNLLPSNLTSLSLAFVGAPSYFLQSGICGSTLPMLLHLILIDKVTEDDSYEWESNWPLIDLFGLPPSLRRLCIQSARGLTMDPSHLPLLPSTLETLELDFMPFLPKSTLLNDRYRAILPPLPPSITKLLLKDSTYYHWHIDCATLPKSLEILSFKASTRVAVHGEGPSEWCTCVIFEGLATHLPHLKELYCKEVRISVADAVRLIPSPVTCLNLRFAKGTTEDASLLMSHFGNRITRAYTYWEELENQFANGQNDFPRLKTLELRHASPLRPCIVPPHVQKLEVSTRFEGDIPLSVTHLFITWSYKATSFFPFNITPQHKLVVLHMPTRFLKRWLTVLPSTLERLRAIFTAEDWVETVRFMSEPGHLPNLSCIKIVGSGALPLDCLTSVSLPPQLLSLRLTLRSGGLDEHILKSHLSKLRSARLEKLSLYFEGEAKRRPIGFFDLLNDLPSNLKTLKLSVNYIPSVQWPVILPSKLMELAIIIRAADSVAALTQWIVDMEKDGCAHSSPFTLPHSLTSYRCDGHPPLPLESLPPNLSILNADDAELRTAYFASRAPPPSSLKRHLSMDTSPSKNH